MKTIIKMILVILWTLILPIITIASEVIILISSVFIFVIAGFWSKLIGIEHVCLSEYAPMYCIEYIFNNFTTPISLIIMIVGYIAIVLIKID